MAGGGGAGRLTTCWAPPEGYLPLAEMTIYPATAPKSNCAKVALGRGHWRRRRTRRPHRCRCTSGTRRPASMKAAGLRGRAISTPTVSDWVHPAGVFGCPEGAAVLQPSVGFEERIRERMDYWDQQRERDASILKRGGRQTMRPGVFEADPHHPACRWLRRWRCFSVHFLQPQVTSPGQAALAGSLAVRWMLSLPLPANHLEVRGARLGLARSRASTLGALVSSGWLHADEGTLR